MKKKIAILGDSLTFGYLPIGIGQMPNEDNWPWKLEQLLKEKYYSIDIEIKVNAQPGRTIIKPLIDFGFPQDNGLNSLKTLYNNAKPFDLMIIFLGTNDYFGYDAYMKMNHSMTFKIEDKIVDSLDFLINKLAELHHENNEEFNYEVLVICPPKVLTMHDGELLTSLPLIYQEYFQKLQIPVVNLQISANPVQEDQITYDGLHYSPNETTPVAKAIFEVIINNNLLKISNK